MAKYIDPDDIEDVKDNIERWDLASLDENEAREVYKLLHEHFKEES